MALLEQLGLGVVGAREPGVGRDVQIEPAAIEDVCQLAPDRRGLAAQAGHSGNVLKPPTPKIAEDSADLRVVAGDHEVIQAIAIQVAEHAAKFLPIGQLHAGRLGDVGESAVAVVAIEPIGAARARDEEIDPAVLIDVAPGT